MKKRILDTDTFSLWLRGDPDVVQKVNAYLSDFDCLTITIINEFEIRRGLEFRNATAKLAQFERFVEDNEILALHPRARLPHTCTRICVVPVSFWPMPIC